MSDEHKANAGEISDEALEAALENDDLEVEDEVSENGLSPEELAAQKEHQEKSKLGRRVSAMEEKFGGFMSRTEQLLAQILEVNKPTSAPDPDEEVSEEDDLILTKSALDAALDRRERNKNKASVKYETGFLTHLAKLGTQEDPDVHEAIIAEMDGNNAFNVPYSNDPVADAERNYFRAARAILKKGGGKVIPGKHEDPAAVGVGGEIKDKGKEVKLPALDDVTKEYIKKMNITEETVRKAFTG